MVMVRFAPFIIEMEGKFGDGYFRRDQCMNHFQLNPHPFEHEETSQNKCFAKAKNFWLSHKPPEGPWWDYAWKHPRINKKGETFYFNPWLAFLSYNIKRCLKGLPIIAAPEST